MKFFYNESTLKDENNYKSITAFCILHFASGYRNILFEDLTFVVGLTQTSCKNSENI